MAVEDVIKLVKKVATEVIPDSIAFTDVKVEASNVVLYTPNVEIFSDNNDLIRTLAQKVRKRIVIKADPSVRKPIISAKQKLEEIMPDDADNFFKYCKEDLKLNITGLMCIPPYEEDSSIHFAYLKKKKLEYKLPHLSIGMSEDYEKAITLGATHIRVGTAIFGQRPQK